MLCYHECADVWQTAGEAGEGGGSWCRYELQQNSQEWFDMTTVLHRGGAADLNLYSLNLTFPLLGWCVPAACAPPCYSL